VLRLCDGRRTLTDIIDESPFRVLTPYASSPAWSIRRLTRCKPQEAPRPTSPVEKSWERRHREFKDSQGLPLSQRPTPCASVKPTCAAESRIAAKANGASDSDASPGHAHRRQGSGRNADGWRA